jgi:hypothetical protein
MLHNKNLRIRDGTKQMNKLSAPGLEKRAHRALAGLTEIPTDFITTYFLNLKKLCYDKSY